MADLVLDGAMPLVTDAHRRRAALTVTDRLAAEEAVGVLLALDLIKRADECGYVLRSDARIDPPFAGGTRRRVGR